jgi:uncharacterized membrane protein (DUF106 family)
MVKKDNAIPRRKKEQVKKLVEGAGMGLGFFVLFGIIIVPGFREGMGNAMDVALGPLADFVGPDNFLITILILSVITGFYTSIIQKYTMNWELIAKSKEYQKQIREFQKEYMEAKKENNKHKIKKIEKKRADVMRKQTQFSGEMMRQQMKPMAYIGIITIPIFMWIWEYVGLYSSGVVIFPLIGAKALSDVFIFSFPFWVLWYMICSIPITQVIRKMLGIRSGM